MEKAKEAPMQKKERSGWKQLSLDERIRIEIRYRDGCSLRAIAEEIGNGRTAGTVSREIAGRPRKEGVDTRRDGRTKKRWKDVSGTRRTIEERDDTDVCG